MAARDGTAGSSGQLIERYETIRLTAGWGLAGTAPGTIENPPTPFRLPWVPAQVPGTVAAALAGAGEPEDGLDDRDWWFHTTFEAQPVTDGEQLVLHLGGIATVAEVYLNGSSILKSSSMFAAHEIDVGPELRPHNELVICCRALAPLLRERRRPRARWRTRLVAQPNLRFFRTMLLGRAPGFAPGPPVVGPWRGVSLQRRRVAVLDGVRTRSRIQGGVGVVEVSGRLRLLSAAQTLDKVTLELTGPQGQHFTESVLSAETEATQVKGQLRVPDPERWWPHTHGAPTLYEAELIVLCGDRQVTLALGKVGFRELSAAEECLDRGIELRINGIKVFARGALWTPVSMRQPDASRNELHEILRRVVDAGMNMLRIPGIGCYENSDFYDLCDELGILVWQDFMFANLDYPETDLEFMAAVELEGYALLERLGHRPSLTVLCGGSEVAQQVAMLGLDPGLASGPLYEELLPTLVREAEVDAPYVPSSPWGGDLPFRPDRGIANYYGVGAYLRPLEDARRAEVKFAAECLAFANVPDDSALSELSTVGGPVVHDPAWKAGVPRDVGAGWDFDDVRDHYLRLLFGVDPLELRYSDPERYIELSRQVTGEVMAEVFNEWRRARSPCGGGLVLWLSDLQPGAGWGILDHRAQPKAAYHHLRRALAPLAVWTTDEGLGGIIAHIGNDGGVAAQATLRVALYRDMEQLTAEVILELELGPHGGCEHNVETLLGRFVDIGWTYRFGPPAQDLVVVSLEDPVTGEPLSQCFRMPVGRPLNRESAPQLGLSGTLVVSPDGAALELTCRRFVYGLRIDAPGMLPEDDVFSLEPGHTRRVALSGAEPPPFATISAINLQGRLKTAHRQAG